MAWLTVNGISKQENRSFTVNNVFFTQDQFQKIAIAGETGSGKTTLLKMIAGLVQPDAGEIIFKGRKVSGPFEKLIPGHPGIAYLSQHFELRNNYRVEEELEAVNTLHENEAKRIYEVCRISHLLQRKTNELSGGERQRIVLARLLITSPKLLLLDEPFSNLDGTHKSIIKSVIRDISDKLNITCMMVLHDEADILSWADSILVMQQGKIIQQGTPEQVYHQPVNEYCAGLFGEYNLIDGKNEAFFPLPGMKLNGKHLLIRPEQFKLHSHPKDGWKGTVKNILFYGSHYTLEIVVGNTVVKVRAYTNQYEKGETVGLSADVQHFWFL
jgi:ABC-type sugar transport system ATPase subunit